MPDISAAAELWLQMLETDFTCELGNHAIQSEHVKYDSATDARRAMLRLAYLKGREDATYQQADFDADVARAMEANKARR